MPGTTSLRTSTHFPPSDASMFTKPVAFPPGRVRDWMKPSPYRIRDRRKYHWDCLCLPQNCGGGRRACDLDNIRLRLDQFSCYRLRSIEVIGHPSEINLKIRSPLPSQVVTSHEVKLEPISPLQGRLRVIRRASQFASCGPLAAPAPQPATPPHRRAPVMNSRRLHSITSSARASSVGGTSRPSAFAVLRLIDQLEFGRRLHRQVGGLRALQDAINVGWRRGDIRSLDSNP